MKLSVSTTLFYGNHIFEVLPELKGFYFDGLELRLKEPHFDYNEDREIEELKRRAKKEKIKILSLHAPSGIDIASLDEWERVRSVREVEKAIVIANRLGAGYVIIHSGEGRKEVNEQHRMLKESLTEIIEFSKDWGILILVENTEPRRVGDSPAELLSILSWFEKSEIGCCLDTSHLNLYGMRMSEGISILGKDIREVHLSDNFGKKDDHLLPYEGKIDWADFLKGLKNVDFRGTMCFELMARKDYKEIMLKIEEMYKEWEKVLKSKEH